MDGTPHTTKHDTPKTPVRNSHPELFIHKKPSSTKKNITPRDSATRLSGMYTPSQVNLSLHLHDSASENLEARIATKASKIPGAVAWVIELLMWHDQPKKKTEVKTSLIRQRVAAELQLPLHCFAQGDWKKKIRVMIDVEVNKQNSRPKHSDDWKKDQYETYPLKSTIIVQTKPANKRPHREISNDGPIQKPPFNSSTQLKRPKRAPKTAIQLMMVAGRALKQNQQTQSSK